MWWIKIFNPPWVSDLGWSQNFLQEISRSIAENFDLPEVNIWKVWSNPPLMHILYVCFLLINFHYIFLRRSCLIGNMGITTWFMSEYFSWELYEICVKICQILPKITLNSVKNFKNEWNSLENCMKFSLELYEISLRMSEIFFKTERIGSVWLGTHPVWRSAHSAQPGSISHFSVWLDLASVCKAP